jgi:hypothetical protein
MNLERLSIALRPRNSWEAIDLGIRFAVRHARPLYAAWLLVTVPSMLVLFLVCHYWLDNLGWLYLFLWWLKPAFDRVAVHVISHAVFGDVPGVRSTLRALPPLLLKTRLLAGLTWERFSPTRSLTLPVDVLEGLRASACRQRKSLIRRRVAGAAFWQGFIFQSILEPVLWLSCLSLTFWLVPNEMWPTFSRISDYFSQPPTWFAVLLYIPLLTISLLLEPLYVAGGFMLYIKRRTDLEAWDLELQLRRLDHAHHTEKTGILRARLLTLVACIMLAFSLTVAPHPAWANPTGPREQAVHRAHDEIKTILQDPRFGKPEPGHELRWHSTQSSPETSGSLPDWVRDLLRQLGETAEAIGNLLASLGRVAGWLLLLAVVITALYLIGRFGGFRHGPGRNAPPAELAGFDIRPQSLPADVALAALQQLREGNSRAALSLLFRGALSHLAHQRNVPFMHGDTEGDCLLRVRQSAPERTAYLARLLGCWQRLAYAHQSITEAEIQALCADWQSEFGGMTHA